MAERAGIACKLHYHHSYNPIFRLRSHPFTNRHSPRMGRALKSANVLTCAAPGSAMPQPHAQLPRRFYLASLQRFEEAELLFDNSYYVGATYLAGYAVECILKALILNSVPKSRQMEVAREFRGQRAHDFQWLRKRYAQTHAPGITEEVRRRLLYVSTWETALRYEPRKGKATDAEQFLKAVEDIIEWAKNRF